MPLNAVPHGGHSRSRRPSKPDGAAPSQPDSRAGAVFVWRVALPILVATFILGLLFANVLRQQQFWPFCWTHDELGHLVLTVDSQVVPSASMRGHVQSISTSNGTMVIAQNMTAVSSQRWFSGTNAQVNYLQHRARLANTMHRVASVQVQWSDGSVTVLDAPRAEWQRLGAEHFWFAWLIGVSLCALSLIWSLRWHNWPAICYGLVCACMGVNILLMSATGVLNISASEVWLSNEAMARACFDLLGAWAILQGCASLTLTPQGARFLGWFTAGIALFIAWGMRHFGLNLFWWPQMVVLFALLVGWFMMARPRVRRERPRLLAIANVSALATLSWLIQMAVIVSPASGHVRLEAIRNSVPAFCMLIIGVALLLIPLVLRSVRRTQELSLAIALTCSGVALCLTLLAINQGMPWPVNVASATLTGLLYLHSRRWMRRRRTDRDLPSTEKMFGPLFRAVREVELNPAKTQAVLSELLTQLFRPARVQVIDKCLTSCETMRDGAALLVPVPQLHGLDTDSRTPQTLVLHAARRAQDRFHSEDARMVDRILEQMKRAVEFDQALERARYEERLRIAQDLHDDIGARLLTMMYKAPDTEMEDYLRHTLQDLKTLTRGLAASTHWLSHAMAEWKADISQRLGAADCELVWSAQCDRDLELTVVQWSALTRVMRELVSNAMAHGHASVVQIELVLVGPKLTLNLCDNGVGTDPKSWSMGLGLGGIRKRVRQLGGQVAWSLVSIEERDLDQSSYPGGGVRCRVSVPMP